MRIVALALGKMLLSTGIMADIENCRALFAILQESTMDMRDFDTEQLTSRANYAELIMKVRCWLLIYLQ